MAGLGGVPRTRRAVGVERQIIQQRQTCPIRAVGTGGAAKLLRMVVVVAAVKHVEQSVRDTRGFALDALALPRQHRRKRRRVGFDLLPDARAVVRADGRAGDDNFLRGVQRVPRRAKQKHFSVELDVVRVNRAAVVPNARTHRAENRIRRVAHEINTVRGNRVANAVARRAGVALIEQMHLPVDDATARRGETVLIRAGCAG